MRMSPAVVVELLRFFSSLAFLLRVLSIVTGTCVCGLVSWENRIVEAMCVLRKLALYAP